MFFSLNKRKARIPDLVKWLLSEALSKLRSAKPTDQTAFQHYSLYLASPHLIWDETLCYTRGKDQKAGQPGQEHIALLYFG